jgi:hypothetical protein
LTDTNPPGSWKKPPEVEAILAIGSLALFAYVSYVVLWQTIPPENEKYAMLMLGALIGVVKDTFGRYFQATKGAQEQRKDAAKVAEKAAETAATLATVQAGAAEPPPAPGTATITAAADVDVALTRQGDAPTTEPVTGKPPWERP